MQAMTEIATRNKLQAKLLNEVSCLLDDLGRNQQLQLSPRSLDRYEIRLSEEYEFKRDGSLKGWSVW